MSNAMVAISPEVRSELAGKYLAFRLGSESYAIRVLDVREIIRYTAITPVPQMPAYIRGVINLRGKIIPVMDLRLRFGLPEAPVTELTCIVVVQVAAASAPPVLMGLIVDAVEAVIQIPARDLESPPQFGPEMRSEGLLAMAKVDKRVVALVDTRAIVAQWAPSAEKPEPTDPLVTAPVTQQP